MSVVENFQFLTGQINIYPQEIPVAFSDDLATVTTAGYLNKNNPYNFPLAPNQYIRAFYNFVSPQDPGTFAFFRMTFAADGVITLTEYDSSNGVHALVIPTIVGQIASYGNTEGDITQGATEIGNNFGNINAGTSGQAGEFISHPATAAKGSLRLKALDNAGAFDVIINNASFGQSSTIGLPDPGAAAAQFAILANAGFPTAINQLIVSAASTGGNVKSLGVGILAQTTQSWGGGATSHAFVATGLTTFSVVSPSILASQNAVSIVKVEPSTDTLTITFSADPGTGTQLNWIAISTSIV